MKIMKSDIRYFGDFLATLSKLDIKVKIKCIPSSGLDFKGDFLQEPYYTIKPEEK